MMKSITSYDQQLKRQKVEGEDLGRSLYTLKERLGQNSYKNTFVFSGVVIPDAIPEHNCKLTVVNTIRDQMNINFKK